MTNFDHKIRSIAEEVASKLAALERARVELESAHKKTEEMLAVASSVGATVLSIGREHEAVENADWPFGYSGSIFTPPGVRYNGSPAAWEIARRSGVYGGAGNTGQAQTDNRGLIDGVYECRDGQWMRIDAAE